jgi:hypothetical protein
MNETVLIMVVAIAITTGVAWHGRDAGTRAGAAAALKCALWVKSKHDALKSRCPLCSQKRTSSFYEYTPYPLPPAGLACAFCGRAQRYSDELLMDCLR